MALLDVANIFWVGGTGANVAMAFARLQYLGLIPRDQGIRHFLIDTPDNLTPKNIALTTFELLDKDPRPEVLRLTHTSYTSFDEFLHAYQHLKPFFEGIPDEDEAKILNTPVKDGNYYIPALAATMAASELEVPDRGLHQRSIICGSCFGGTGSGVAPALARQLLVHGNQQVEIMYLNDWLVNNNDEDGKRRRNPNQVANLRYLEQLCKTMQRKRGVNCLSYYVMRVSDDGTQIAPPWTHSNTDTEIPNPFPYYAAMFIQSLLIPARGQLLPESGVWAIHLDRHALANNPSFAYAYAYNRLFPSLERQRCFSYVLDLVDGKSGKDWGLARLHWSREFLTQIRDLESGEPAKRELARAAIVEKECQKFDFQRLGWPGFVVKPGDMPAVDTQMLSYPSLFAAAFYFQEHVLKEVELRDAYLALVALVATRQVYAVRDQWLDKYCYQEEFNAQPIILRDSEGTTVGYGGPPELYLWPAFPRHARLRELLDSDFVLQEALFRLHEENENQSTWRGDTILGRALNIWSRENRNKRSQGRVKMPSFSRRFFEEAEGTGEARGIAERRRLPANAHARTIALVEEHLKLELEYHENGRPQRCSTWIACDDYHLGVSGPRILQWFNLGRTPVTEDQALDNLVLDYRTVIQVENTGYKVEVVDSGDHDGAGTLGREAYLALVALVAAKRVYTKVEESAVNNADAPITFRTGNGEIVGDTAPQGEYVRPRVEVYRSLRDRLHNDNTLQEVLHAITQVWPHQDYLGRTLRDWRTQHPLIAGADERWFSLAFFQELTLQGDNHPLIGKVSVRSLNFQNNTLRLDVLRQDNILTGELFLSGVEHHLWVPDGQQRVIQYTHVLQGNPEIRNEQCIIRQGAANCQLVLNYRTVLDLSGVQGGNYQVKVIHPSHIFVDQTFEFTRVQPGSGSAEPYIPWPLRKEYMDCLEPVQGWSMTPRLEGGYLDMTPHRIKNWGRDGETIDQMWHKIDPGANRHCFHIPVAATLAGEGRGVKAVETGYQGYVWPCNPDTNCFVRDWNYYSLLVARRPAVGPTKTSQSLAEQMDWVGNQDRWYFITESNWVPLEEWEYAGTYVAAWQGEPPRGLAIEVWHDHRLYGACFPFPQTVEPDRVSEEDLKMGIDLGTADTLAAVRRPDGIKPVQMEPSDLLYPLFSTKRWDQLTELDFAWIPSFRREVEGNRTQLMPSLLWTVGEPNWSVSVPLPLLDFTIPGDTLGSVVLKGDSLQRNIKWDDKLGYCEHFLTAYLVFLGAHLFVGSPLNTPRPKQIYISATVPLRFESTKVSLPRYQYQVTRAQAFAETLQRAAQQACKLIGAIQFAVNLELRYESLASIPEILEDQLAVFVDVGAGSTDVAVFKGLDFMSASSFSFAGHNLLREEFGDDAIFEQRRLRGGWNPFSGTHRGNAIKAFLHLIGGYTALLAAAAILQSGMKDEIKGNLERFRLYLLGRAWHLGKFDPDSRGNYVDTIVKRRILHLFNNQIRSNVLGSNFPSLNLTNIYMDTDPLKAKEWCARGALDDRSRTALPAECRQNPPLTFLGLSYEARSGQKVPWYESGNVDPLRVSHDALDLNADCPALLIEKTMLENIFRDNIRAMSQDGDPLNADYHIVRNVMEFLLEKKVGGFDDNRQGGMKKTMINLRNVREVNEAQNQAVDFDHSGPSSGDVGSGTYDTLSKSGNEHR